jgi:hypothetical protein
MSKFEQGVLQKWLQANLELESTTENKVYRLLIAINFIQTGDIYQYLPQEFAL